MITGLSGKLVRVKEEEVRLVVGAIEYQVLVPEFVRRTIQTNIGEEITFHTLEFLEGNPTRGKIIPRLVGFLSEAEIEFFELFCTVDGIGVRTALKAMVRPIRDVADMIQRQDPKVLATLPGISASTAERVIAKLRKKVTKFALMIERPVPEGEEQVDHDVIQEAFLALVSVGHPDTEAREKLDEVLQSGKRFKNAHEILLAVYQDQAG